MATKAAPKVEPREFEDWAAINRALGRLAVIEPRQAELEADLTQRIAVAKAEFEPEIERIDREVESITLGFTAFLTAHRSALVDGKTIELKNGSLALALNPAKLVTKGRTTWQHVLDVLKTLPARIRVATVRTKMEVDREALKQMIADDQLSDEQLTALGVALIQEERVTYTLAAEQAAARG